MIDADADATDALVVLTRNECQQGYEPDEVRELISKSIRGELTEQESVTRFSFRDKGFVLAIAKTLKDKNVVHKTDIKAIENVLMPVLMCSIAGLGDLEGLKVHDGVQLRSPRPLSHQIGCLLSLENRAIQRHGCDGR